MTSFSLFEGDPLSRLFLRIGIRNRGPFHLLARFLCLLIVTFVPTACLAWWKGYALGQPRTMNFFGDAAAFGQAFIGYPLFIIAESLIGDKTRGAARHFEHSGVVLPGGREKLSEFHDTIARLRKWWLPETCCLLLGALFSFFWINEEMHNAYSTWHAVGAPYNQWPTLPGWWCALVGVPIFNFWWLRWIWKISLWCWYLYKVSRLRLRLIASHPDLTGGLGFLTEAQTSYAVVIFAFGIGCIAPLVGYKLEIEHSDIFSFAVGGPLLAFIIGAPLLFTLPLMMFTKQLYRAKKRALEAYENRATAVALEFEERWLAEDSRTETTAEGFRADLGGMSSLHKVFEIIEGMRVVPFDLKSFTELMGSTVGSLLPLFIKWANLPEPTKKFLEMIKPFFGAD